MSLPQIQFNKALKKALLKQLKDGTVPSLSKTTAEVNRKLPEEQGLPTVKSRPQRAKTNWDLTGMNTTLEEVGFDVEVMYDTLIDIATRTIRRLNLTETSSRAQHAQMDRIENLALSLLFTIRNADGYFEGFFDDFHDFSKVDLSLTTRDCIDLSSQSVELPQNAVSSKKISLDHLLTSLAWPTVVNANSSLVTSVTPTDAPFRNAILDTISMWRHDVITEEGGPVSLEFTIPVRDMPGGELSISRVQLTGVSGFVQQAEILYSVDGVNYLKFPKATNLVELSKSSRAVNIDFPLTRVEFIRVILYRETFDKVVEKGYLTSFGLRNISLYALGRNTEARLVSKVFEVEDGDKIEKVSLSVSEEVPPGTQIQYYIGALPKEEIDTEQKEIDGTWVPITPTSRGQVKDEAPRILRMTSLSKNTHKYIPKTPLTAFEKYKGINFYQLNGTTDNYNERLVTEDIIYGSAVLFRGRDAWLRKKNAEYSLFNVSNAFISFSSGPRQKLYTTSKETVNFDSVLNWDEQNRSTLVLSRPIDYRPAEGMSLIPPDGIDAFSVPDPLHAIYQVRLSTPGDEAVEVLVLPTSGKAQFTNSPIDITETQDTVIYLSAYSPSLGTHDDSLIQALESRNSLASYHGKIIKNMVSISTAADISAGKPQLTRFTIGNSDANATPHEFNIDGEVTKSTGTPAPSQRALTELSDEELLNLFGRVTLRTTLTNGVIGESADGLTKYLPDIDFSLEVIDNPTTGVPELWVSRTPNSSISGGASITFKFRFKEDLTQDVLTIQGSRIYMKRSYSGLPDGTKVIVTYRYIPTGVNEVLKESLRIVPDPSSDSPFLAGRDYHFNPKDATITLISSGNIPQLEGKTSVYASFTHKGALNSLETFSTWVWVSSKDPIKLHYNRLEVDTEFGEKILISTGKGPLVDISNTTETPELSYGWHQVLVLSRDPDIYPGTAIKKMAELLDLDGNPIFLAGGEYFTEMRGTRVPLTQVPVDFLKNNVFPSDHSKFAVDSAGRVLVNFQPNTQEDFFTYGYRSQTVGAEVQNVRQYYNEQFSLTYDYHRTEAKTIDALVLRAVLSRGKDTDGSITPKLLGYQIRVG